MNDSYGIGVFSFDYSMQCIRALTHVYTAETKAHTLTSGPHTHFKHLPVLVVVHEIPCALNALQCSLLVLLGFGFMV